MRERDEKGRFPEVKHIARNCDYCGQQMALAPWQIKRRPGTQKFCSKHCFYEGRKCTQTFQNGHPDLVPKEKRGHAIETRHKIAAVQREKKIRGEEHWNWRGGKRKERSRLMGQWEYRIWRKAVFDRDNYTCVACGDTRVYLHADHIKPWSKFPELRYDLSNGRTLCVDCHRQTSTWGNRQNNREYVS